MQPKRFVFLGLGIVLGVALVLLAFTLLERSYTFQGVLIDPPAPAADFTLTDHNGQPYRLSDQREKVVLIFFGYTNCPDVCPITLSEYKKIKAILGEQASKISFVFITVDPERDSPERLAAYVPGFDPQFLGLTGERSALEEIWKNYGVYVERRDVGSASGYLVDHSARIYLIDIQGNWRLNYPFGMEPEKIAQDIIRLLREK
jgi:protein SCO1/2